MKKLCLFVLMGVAAATQAQTRLIARLVDVANAKTLATKYNITYLDQAFKAPFVLYSTKPGQDPVAIQTQMQADPAFAWVDDDDDLTMPETTGKGSTIGAINDRSAFYAENKTILQQIHWTSVYASQGGRSVKLAVLDTGLSQKQADLWSRTAVSVNLVEPGQAPYDMPRNTDSNHNGLIDEGLGHGTMVAGVVSQIAPRVSLVIIRIADSDGHTTAWRIIKGLTFAVLVGSEVANISMGADHRIAALSDVLDWTETQNLLVCAPIGNDNQGGALAPASNGKVVCVSGIDPQNVKASFSNFDGKALSAAPATGIKSYWWDGSMGIWSGTSFAAPFVSATIADGLRQTHKLSPAALRALVQPNGFNIDSYNPQYKGKLGTRLDYVRLSQAIWHAGSAPRP